MDHSVAAHVFYAARQLASPLSSPLSPLALFHLRFEAVITACIFVHAGGLVVSEAELAKRRTARAARREQAAAAAVAGSTRR